MQQGDGQNKKKKATGKNVYRITSSQTYKKKRRVVGKLPPAGERRMLRKRIVLSNTNAYEIKGLQDLSPQNMADEAYVGHMLGLEGNTLDQLRHAKAFKKTQNWNLFRRPATLVRPETVELGKKIELVNESLLKDEGAKREVLKQVIAGERISGKSILLLQALSMGYMNKWIVINIPESELQSTRRAFM
jgi:small subunit ribosomal protein S29